MTIDNSDQLDFYVTMKDKKQYGSRMYWSGIVIGAVTMFFFCLGVGYFLD